MSQVVTPPAVSPERGQKGRIDGRLKVSGQAQYTNDLKLPDMMYAAVVRSPYPHAKILRIDKQAAEGYPGVTLVVTGDDIPYGTFGRIVCDVPVLARDVVRFAGEKVAAVVATSLEAAEAAAAVCRAVGS